MDGMHEHTTPTAISMADHLVMFCWSHIGFWVRANVIKNWRRMIEMTVALR
jgi:hypothetical protein